MDFLTNLPLHYSFSPYVSHESLETSTGIVLKLSLRDYCISIRNAEFIQLFKKLFYGSFTLDDIVNCLNTQDILKTAQFYHLFNNLIENGLFKLGIHESSILLELIPIPPYFRMKPFALKHDVSFKLSQHCYLRWENGHGLLCSPLVYAQVLLYDDRICHLLSHLSLPRSNEELQANMSNLLDNGILKIVLQLLVGANMLTIVDENGKSEEDTHRELKLWEFHDLLFHARTRWGRHIGNYGATYRFKDTIEPYGAIKEGFESDERIRLFCPNVEGLLEDDVPFTRVLEERQSVREFRQDPITLEQLGELLYRSARIRKREYYLNHEITRRPYPSGGSLYELEIYLAINSCVNLERGMYWYDPLHHMLHKKSIERGFFDKLLSFASSAAGETDSLQILVIFAARFQRVSWKYEAIAYSLILKNVGVLMQTISLVATAMGLGSCILGAGDSDCFSKAIGTDEYLAESSVGEMIIGSI